MNEVRVEEKTYQMPPQDGFTVAHFLTVADVERSLRFYETVFGGRILSRGDSKGAPGYIQNPLKTFSCKDGSRVGG
jgi:predicted enzyme related to lactoylglutathione lyase